MTSRLLSCVALLAAGCVDVPQEEVGTSTGQVSVTWSNLVGVTASGNDLTKVSGGNSWNAGAVSVESLTGDGYVEFTVGETGTAKAAGLSSGDSGQSYTDIDFALRLTAGGAVQVHEAGVLRGSFGTYAAGERFRVEAKGGSVRYSRSGAAPFYTSAVAPSFPLLVDTSLLTPGATINDVELVATTLAWQNVVGVAVSGDSLTKTAGTSGWNAGASSVQTLAGDGFVDFAVADSTTAKAAGLSSGDSDQSYTDIDYGLRLNANGVVYVWEAGVLRGNFGSYLAGDRFRVEVSGGIVSYSRNGGAPFYTSAVAPSFPLLVDTSFSTPGATLHDLALVDAANACPAYDGTGLVCTGTFVVNNAFDLQQIATCANITGNLTISAPGMTEIALPLLERIGGNLTVTNNPDVAQLRLPALKEIGGATLIEVPAATDGVDLSHLRSAGRLESRVQEGLEMSYPCLDTSGTVYATDWLQVNSAPLHVPRLRQIDGTFYAGSATTPALTVVTGSIGHEPFRNLAVSLDAPNLTDVGGAIFYDDGVDVPALERAGGVTLMAATTLDLPALVEVGTLAPIWEDLPQPTISSIDLPSLERASLVNLTWNALEEVSLPSLTSVGGFLGIRSTAITQPVTLPQLSLIEGAVVVTVPLNVPALTEVRDTVYINSDVTAPVLETIVGDLELQQFAGAVSLPALVSVGGITCLRGAVTSIDLPALTQVSKTRKPYGLFKVHDCDNLTSISTPLLESIGASISVRLNNNLTSLDFSSLTSLGGDLSINRNPVLPSCYATDVYDQLVANGWSGTATVYDNNGTGSCP